MGKEVEHEMETIAVNPKTLYQVLHRNCISQAAWLHWLSAVGRLWEATSSVMRSLCLKATGSVRTF